MAVAILGELTDRGLAVISGLGERLLAPILAAAIRARGLQGRVRGCRRADRHRRQPRLGRARHGRHARRDPRPAAAAAGSAAWCRWSPASSPPPPTACRPCWAAAAPTTRPAILGAALDADEVQIWTDVDGVLTADPRIVKDARPLPELTYSEAAELAYFGAKVLHPKTMLPAIDRGIPISVRNTFNPTFPGTRVVAQASNGGTVKALTVIRGLALVTVAGRGMMGVPGIAARTFAAVAAQDANVLMISQASSEQSICFVVPEAGRRRGGGRRWKPRSPGEIHRRLIDRVTVEPQIVIVAVVGEGMRGTPGIAARLFGALGERSLNVIAVAQGSSEANISLVLAAADADAAVRYIHAAFGLAG